MPRVGNNPHKDDLPHVETWFVQKIETFFQGPNLFFKDPSWNVMLLV